MNRCRPEKKGTKEHGELLNIIPNPEKGKVSDGNAEGWKVVGERDRGVTRKECKRPREEFEGFFLKKKNLL